MVGVVLACFQRSAEHSIRHIGEAQIDHRGGCQLEWPRVLTLRQRLFDFRQHLNPLPLRARWLPKNLLTPCAQARGRCHQPSPVGKLVAQPSWLRTHDSSVNELFITYRVALRSYPKHARHSDAALFWIPACAGMTSCPPFDCAQDRLRRASSVHSVWETRYGPC